MLEQAIRAKTVWGKGTWFRHDPWERLGFTVYESQREVFAATANELGVGCANEASPTRLFAADYLGLNFAIESGQLWSSNWYGAGNTGGTVPGILVVPGDLNIVQICERNFCYQPWTDEFTEILPFTFEVVGQPTEGGLTVITEAVTRDTEPSEQELLNSWDRYLEEHMAKLISQYKGKYVAIWNNAVYDSDEDLATLAQRVYAALGYRPVFMPYIGKPKTMVEFLSPV